MDSLEPHIQTQTMQKANSEFLTCFEAQGEKYPSRIVTAYETGSITGDKKAIHGKAQKSVSISG